MLRFRASAVASLEDDYLFCVVMAEDEDGNGTTLELQVAHSFDEQDRKLGMDTYCIVLDGSTHYGGVTEWLLTPALLDVRLDEEAARVLEVDGFLVELDASAPKTLLDDVTRVLGEPRRGARL